MIKFSIDGRILKGMAVLASRDETRYVLNSVCVEQCADGTMCVVATDGKRIGVVHVTGNADMKPGEQMLIPPGSHRQHEDGREKLPSGH